MTTVKLINRRLYPSDVTYMSINNPTTITVNGGTSLEVKNTSSLSDSNFPDNILNLPVNDDDIKKEDFRYDKNTISIKITK